MRIAARCSAERTARLTRERPRSESWRTCSSKRWVGGGPGTWTDRILHDRFSRRFEPRQTDFDWLSRDKEEVRKYVDDRLCGFPLTAQAWLDFLHGKSHLGDDEHVAGFPRHCPFTLLPEPTTLWVMTPRV